MPSSTKTITKTVVDALKPGETVWDSKFTGFGVRCQRRDKVYVLKTRIGSRQRWFTIGKHGSPFTVDMARKRALTISSEIAEGGDPATARDEYSKNPTMAEACQRFMTEYVIDKRPATQEQYGDLLRRYIAPKLGQIRIADLTENDLDRLHKSLRDKPTTANRTLAVVSKLLSWAEKKKLRPHNSNFASQVDRFKENARERFLSAFELARLGEAISGAEVGNTVTPHAIAAIRLLMLTGARRNEILTLRWDQVSVEQSALLLPTSKSGKPKAIHLSAPALEVLSSLPRIEGNPYVIAGKKEGQRLVNLRKPWKRVCKAAGLDDLRLHDLRHSFASAGVNGGTSLPMIGKLLGHSNTQTTERYSHLQTDPVKAANEEISSRIAAMMKGQGAEIINLSKDRKAN